MNTMEMAFMSSKVQMHKTKKEKSDMNLNGYWWSEYPTDSTGYVCISGVWCKCCLRCAHVRGLLNLDKFVRMGNGLPMTELLAAIKKMNGKAPTRDICRVRNHLIVVDIPMSDKYQIGYFKGGPLDYKVFSIDSLLETYNTLDEAKEALYAVRMAMVYEITLPQGTCLLHKVQTLDRKG